MKTVFKDFTNYVILLSVLAILVGIVLVACPDTSLAALGVVVAVYIGVVIGLWVIVAGFSGIKFAAALRGTGANWVLMIILNIIDIIIGCLILYAPSLYAASLTMVLGIVLIIHSVINIINMISVKKDAKELEKLVLDKPVE